MNVWRASLLAGMLLAAVTARGQDPIASGETVAHRAGSQPADDREAPASDEQRPRGRRGGAERSGQERGLQRRGTDLDATFPRGDEFQDGRGDRPRRAEGAGRGPQGPPDEAGGSIKPEEVDEFLQFTREHFPEVHEQLLRARQHDGREFRQMLRRLGPPMLHLMRLWRNDPEEAERIIQIQKVEMQIREQKHRYDEADNSERRAAARSELQQLLDRKFDLRQERLKAEISDLRRRLDEQTRRLSDQDARKRQIIEGELKRLFEGPRGFEPRRPGRITASAPESTDHE